MAKITITLNPEEVYELGDILEEAFLPCVASFSPTTDLTTSQGRLTAMRLMCEGLFRWLRNTGKVHTHAMELAQAEVSINQQIGAVDIAALAAVKFNGEPLISVPLEETQGGE